LDSQADLDNLSALLTSLQHLVSPGTTAAVHNSLSNIYLVAIREKIYGGKEQEDSHSEQKRFS